MEPISKEAGDRIYTKRLLLFVQKMLDIWTQYGNETVSDEYIQAMETCASSATKQTVKILRTSEPKVFEVEVNGKKL